MQVRHLDIKDRNILTAARIAASTDAAVKLQQSVVICGMLAQTRRDLHVDLPRHMFLALLLLLELDV